MWCCIKKAAIAGATAVAICAGAASALGDSAPAADGAGVICEGGVCRLVDAPGEVLSGGVATNAAASANGAGAAEPTRMAQGYMPAEKLVDFLNGVESSALLPSSVFLLPFVLLLAGIALNLTPCVLPMIPVNLLVIGRSAMRGLLYGLGMTLAYGVLGVAAAVGGLAFGAIQSNPWFNAGVAVVFVALALALLGVFRVDFSGRRFRAGAFMMGVLSAVLAGACVAPVLVSVLLLTADMFAKGSRIALGLPFLLGLGMALPWPFLGAGMRVLPKPGAWMRWVNRGFAIVVIGLAVWYATLSWRGFAGAEGEASAHSGGDAIAATPATFMDALAAAGEERPVLVDCWATWCKNCAAMDAVMADARVKEALRGYSVIRLQAEDIGELRRLPGFERVQGLPAFLIFASRR